MGPVAAQRAQVVARRLQPVGAQQLLDAVVVDGGPLELEEEQLGLHRRAALLHARQQRAVGRIGRVDREAQHRVGAGAAEAVDDRLELGHGGGQPRAVELADPAGVALGEARGALVGLVEEAVGAFRAVAVDQRIEVPGDLLDVSRESLTKCALTKATRSRAAWGALRHVGSRGSAVTSERRASQPLGLALCGSVPRLDRTYASRLAGVKTALVKKPHRCEEISNASNRRRVRGCT